jgi:hypothetical protein
MNPVEKEVYDAEKDLNRLTSSWNKQVAKAEKALKEAQDGAYKPLGRHRQVYYNEVSVTTPDGTAYFKDGPIAATVDTAGNIAVSQRITLTRLVAGGVIGGLVFPKKKMTDTRELYLMVQTPTFASLVECMPKEGSSVRQVANGVNNMSRAWQNAAVQRQARIQAATDNLQKLQQQQQQEVLAAQQRVAQGSAQRPVQQPNTWA